MTASALSRPPLICGSGVEQLAVEVRAGADAAGGEVGLAGVGLGPGHELLQVARGVVGARGHDVAGLGDLADVVALNAFSEEDLVGKVEEADAIMLYHFISISRFTIERLRKCKLIVRCGVGYDNVDRVFARERGIDVANVPDYGSEEVADSAIGMTLTLMRGIHYLNSRCQQEQGPWIYEQVRPLHRLRGLTFGIIGLECALRES